MIPPSPPRALIICSLAGLLLCAVLCGICVAAMLHSWQNHGLGLGGLLLLPGFLGLGLTQYAGIFQGKPARAEMVARLYSFSSGFMLIALVCVFLDIARSGRHPSWPVIAVGSSFALFAAWGRIGGRLNRQWATQLRRFEDAQEGDAPLPSRKGPPIVWASILLVFLVATGTVYAALGPRWGEHVDPATTPLLLPMGAADVSYWVYAGNTAFEFSISEKEFLAWANAEIKSRQAQFDKIQPLNEPVTVVTYRAWLPDAPQPHETTIHEGYYHEWEQDGKKIQFAFDRATGRAYYAAYRPLARSL